MSFFNTGKKPYLVAGPCSAETREQVLETAAGLAGLNVDLFRAGVWKPRTRPGSFEGNGYEALTWLEEVKAVHNLKTTIEVAEAAHVELALKHNVDVLWIGARTTVNPFQVQAIADALKGVNIPVMVKNPVNPDVELWLGAIERFEKVGITSVAAIHRGFSVYKTSSVYRNQPNWIIPVELRRRRKDIPIICDPSHITGQRDKIFEVSQKAMDMHFEGLMIETHPDPDNAWSDAAQQITPATLKILMSELVIRELYTLDMGKTLELEHLRQMMDSVDAEIIDLLARRLELSERVGYVKKACNMTAYQPDRWREIVATRGSQAKKLGIDEEYIVGLFDKIHHNSVKKQLQILQQEEENDKKSV